jgi:hypothetical protein
MTFALLSQGLRRDNFLAKVPGPDRYQEAKNAAPRHGRQLIKPPGR